MEKDINVNDVVKYLNRAFSKAAWQAGDKIGKSAVRTEMSSGAIHTTPLYDYQVNFSYLINTIQRGEKYASRKAIQQANDLIHDLEQESLR